MTEGGKDAIKKTDQMGYGKNAVPERFRQPFKRRLFLPIILNNFHTYAGLISNYCSIHKCALYHGKCV